MSRFGLTSAPGIATWLRPISALAVLALCCSSAVAQPAATSGRPETTVGKYKVLTIQANYDIRLSDEMSKLDEKYQEDYKLLTSAEKTRLRAAKKKTSEARARRNDAMKTVRRVLSGDASVDDNRARLDYWFKRIVFPEMTQVDTKSLQNLPTIRNEFARDYLQRAQKNPNAHNYLVRLTMDELKYIAENEFHPAVRYHAVLMIGQLNSREAVLLGSPKSPPVPYAPALDYLLGLFKDDKKSDAIRVASLLGILRHTELLGPQMPEDDRNKVIDAMLATLKADPGNRSPSGHAWIQRRAAEVLGALQQVGAGGKVAQQLQATIEDDKADLYLRCTAAVAYGKLNFGAGVEPKAAKVAASVGQMIAEEARARLDWLVQEQEAMKERAESGMGSGDEAGGAYDESGMEGGGIITASSADEDSPLEGSGELTPMGMEEFGTGEGYGTEVDPEKMATELEKHRLEALRRRIKYPVYCAQVALGAKMERGSMRAATDRGLRRFVTEKEESEFVEDLLRELGDLQDAANAGMDEEEEAGPSRTAELTPATDVKLPTEQFKEELLVAVRQVEDLLRRAPASIRPAPKASSTPEEVEGPDRTGPSGTATAPTGPATGPPAGP